MKRILVLTALIVFASGAAQAEGTVMGFKAGVNLANVWGEDTDFFDVSNGIRVAFGGGLFLTHPLNDNISIQPELFFMMKGTKYEEGDDKLTVKLNYIDINFLAKITIPSEGKISPFFMVGPQIGILMTADWEADNGTTTASLDMKDQYKSFDFGLAFGAGFDYMLESGVITFDIRYNLGLMNIPDVDDVSHKNSGIIFMLGYGFSL